MGAPPLTRQQIRALPDAERTYLVRKYVEAAERHDARGEAGLAADARDTLAAVRRLDSSLPAR